MYVYNKQIIYTYIYIRLPDNTLHNMYNIIITNHDILNYYFQQEL